MHLFVVDDGVAVINHTWLPGFIYCQGEIQQDIVDSAQKITEELGNVVTEELMDRLDNLVIDKFVAATGVPEVREVLEAIIRLPDSCMGVR